VLVRSSCVGSGAVNERNWILVAVEKGEGESFSGDVWVRSFPS
jgi:hypothetical protein